MEINLNNAVKLFFSNPSLEMVYFEAIANAIDADATIIDIKISISSFTRPDSLVISIEDNGVGFIDANFKKFSKLLEIESDDHKGMGRLVFLHYFEDVDVISKCEAGKRVFKFNNDFKGKSTIDQNDYSVNTTTLILKNYKKEKIKSYDYLKPASIKKSILLHFYPLFYSMKIENRDLTIKISCNTEETNIMYNFVSDEIEFKINDIPELTKESFKDQRVSLLHELDLFYSIREDKESQTIITALCVDGRTLPINIVSKDGIPFGYEIVFLLYSGEFTGKTNMSRQELAISDTELNTIKNVFREKVALIIQKNIPQIEETNNKIRSGLENRYPHLTGYFTDNTIGLLEREEVLKDAQSKFFNAQKEILDAISLDDAKFEKSLEISSRILTEYILYRTIIIKNLKAIDFENSETEIHNLIVPKGKTFKKNTFINDIYHNNAWLLDDKYMSYTTILSDVDMDKVVKEILLEGESIDKDESRPDIAIIFSKDPADPNTKFDIVVVELKKLGLKLAKREEIVSQLRQRARKLLKYYNNRIQRIWFYGIVDFDKDFIRSLKEDKYLQIYSKGHHYYREHDIIPDDNDDIFVPIGVNLISFDAFLDDAETRNSTFLNILKAGLK